MGTYSTCAYAYQRGVIHCEESSKRGEYWTRAGILCSEPSTPPLVITGFESQVSYSDVYVCPQLDLRSLERKKKKVETNNKLRQLPNDVRGYGPEKERVGQLRTANGSPDYCV